MATTPSSSLRKNSAILDKMMDLWMTPYVMTGLVSCFVLEICLLFLVRCYV